MRSIQEVKIRAKNIRDAVNTEGYPITHTESLEVVSRLEGYRNWNTYSSHLKNSATLLPIASGWWLTGDTPENYEVGRDPAYLVNNQPAAVIRSKPSALTTTKTFATLMQSMDADHYRGKRVSLQANLRATNCQGVVTLWLRADGPEAGKYLAFDNMEGRVVDGPLNGTGDWCHRSIVLSIPTETEELMYGFYLRGSGTAHMANLKIQIVDDSVPVTVESE